MEQHLQRFQEKLFEPKNPLHSQTSIQVKEKNKEHLNTRTWKIYFPQVIEEYTLHKNNKMNKRGIKQW